MLVTSRFSTRTFLCLAMRSARVFGVSDRRWVAMTVQPFSAYCLANSSPMPELAPVISTVSASATAAAATQARATSPVPTQDFNRMMVLPRPSPLQRPQPLLAGVDPLNLNEAVDLFCGQAI